MPKCQLCKAPALPGRAVCAVHKERQDKKNEQTRQEAQERKVQGMFWGKGHVILSHNPIPNQNLFIGSIQHRVYIVTNMTVILGRPICKVVLCSVDSSIPREYTYTVVPRI